MARIVGTLPLMSCKAVIFDLDGTLVDTLKDIAIAANHALAQHGYPSRPIDDFRLLAGQGIENLYRDATGQHDQELIASLVEKHISYYAEHGLDHSQPFEGLLESLQAMQDAGIQLGVLSNKRHEAVVPQIDALFPEDMFAIVRGAQAGIPLKPDPEALLSICRKIQLDASEVAYVGDTAADMGAGSSAGCLTIGVTWGFRDEEELRATGADVIVHHPSELLAAIEASESHGN